MRIGLVVALLIGTAAAVSAAAAPPILSEYKKTFGSVTGYKFPGVFGPFGDQAFSYVVPVAADRVIMVIAHKYYFNDPSHSDRTPARTNYDEVVDALLSTLAVKDK
jgi:hypothetical protein